MRALVAIAIAAVGIAGVTAARAADLADGQPGRNYYTHHSALGRRVAPLVIYDYEPGVVVRAYWLAPWRHRHYYPFGAGKQGHNLTPADNAPEPAQTFERYWSTSHSFQRGLPPADDRPTDAEPAPREKQSPPVFEK